MPTVYASAFGPLPQFVDENGEPRVGAKLFSYVAGSISTKQNTYTNSTGGVANPNPIILDLLGNPPNEYWWDSSGYKIVLAPPNDTDPPTSPYWTIDNLYGQNNVAVTVGQWQAGPTPTYISGTSFTLAGDQTSTFHIGRRLQFTVTAGTVYGRILTSAFGANTAVTMVMDGSQALDNGLTAVFYSLLTNNVLSVPERIATATGTDTYVAAVGALRYVIGDEYRIRIPNANTSTTPTLNLDGLGAVTIVKNGGAVLAGGDMQANGEYTFRYITGNKIQLLNPFNQIPALRNFIDGFAMTAAGASASITWGAGQASDSTNAILLNLAAALTKTTAAWAVGTGNGGKLSAAAIANNTWYHFYEIYRADTGVVDVGFDTSATTPTLPANYTHYRRIGSWNTDGAAQWFKGASYGEYFQKDAPTNDVNANNPGAAAILRTISVPLGLRVRALCASQETNGSTNRDYYWTDPAVADTAPSTPPLTGSAFTSANNLKETMEIQIWTNTASQVRYRSNATGAGDNTFLSVKGWFDQRGKDA